MQGWKNEINVLPVNAQAIVRISKIQSQIDSLQTEIKELSTAKIPIAVIGGLGGCGSLADAKIGCETNLEILEPTHPEESKIYCKGNWEGMLFAKFEKLKVEMRLF